MQVREATTEDKQRWNDFVMASEQGSFLQAWEWGVLQAEEGHTVWRLVVEVGGEWQAVLLLVRRELPMGACWLYGPWGPVFASNPTQDVWQTLQNTLEEIADEEQAVWVRVDAPFQEGVGEGWQRILKETGWQKSEREVQPQETLILDLDRSEEELLAGMKSKTRYNVRLAERKGVRVRFSTDVADVDLFWQVAGEVSGRSGFSYHPKKYYETLMDTLDAELAIAEHEGEVLAVHMMVYVGGRATYVHGASSSKKRNLMAPALLYWETIRQARQKGCASYDFWGVAPEGAGSEHPWSGVTRIKLGFGGRRERYVGAYDLVLKSWMYQGIAVARRVRRML